MAAVAGKNGAELHEKPLVAFLRGDHMLNEAKLAGAVPQAQIPSDARGGDLKSSSERRQASSDRLA